MQFHILPVSYYVRSLLYI